jgi:nitroimidazol reductase NimA-like FMN-containing flavoprotein (pyridoxamine 5'-phosphate oxidase superfamily)
MAPFHVRRTDREITDEAGLASILQRGKYAVVAMCHDGEPYLVTLSYGYDADRRALYFHVAAEGRKLDAIAADPRVCATVVIDNGYEAGACKHHYESVVLTGRMALVTDPDEQRAGMRVLLAHLEADPDPVWERNKLDLDAPWKRMGVVRLDIEHVTGKAGS